MPLWTAYVLLNSMLIRRNSPNFSQQIRSNDQTARNDYKKKGEINASRTIVRTTVYAIWIFAAHTHTTTSVFNGDNIAHYCDSWPHCNLNVFKMLGQTNFSRGNNSNDCRGTTQWLVCCVVCVAVAWRRCSAFCMSPKQIQLIDSRHTISKTMYSERTIRELTLYGEAVIHNRSMDR